MSFIISLPNSSDSKQPLHTGKWTHEESEYVQELIKEFEAGALNIEDNISLRRFLSQALNCSPKRISKKFEGTLYNGKQLYKRKVSEMAPEQVAARRARLHELEKKYQESLKVLELVENSRKPTPTDSGTTTNVGVPSKTATKFLTRTAEEAKEEPAAASVQPQPPLSLSGAAAGASMSSFASFPATREDISRAARIAKLKADIAIASMTLVSAQPSPTFPSGPAASLHECLMQQGRSNVLASSTDATSASNDPIMAHLMEEMAQREILARMPASEGSTSSWVDYSSLTALAHQRQLERRQQQLINLSFLGAQTASLSSTDVYARVGRGPGEQLQLDSLIGKHSYHAAMGNEGPAMKRFRLT